MNIFFFWGGGVKMIDDFLFTCIYIICIIFFGGGVEVQGCIHFSFEAHLSSTLLTMKLTELHWIRQLQYQLSMHHVFDSLLHSRQKVKCQHPV